MFCVNVKLKEFKDACNRLNIHPSSLETIVFQYLNNVNSKGFPSDSYIMEKLQGISMTNASNEQIQLWEKVHSKPIVLKTTEQVAAKIKELSKYYTPESISSYRNNNGDYIITVAEPVNQEAVEKEITNILVNAPRNSKGQLLTPNGKPTKLTERQYALVRTKAFKKWFGDWTKITQDEDGSWNIPDDVSKVIDIETGEPKVVYHGSPNKFTIFGKDISSKRSWTYEDTFYFTDSRINAETYGKNVVDAFLNIRNPYVYDFEGRSWRNLKFEISVTYGRDNSILASGFATKEEAQAWLENFKKENPEHYAVKDENGRFLNVNENTITGQAGLTTDEQTQKAKVEGYDGNIQKNISDTAGGEWVVGEDGVAREEVDPEVLKPRTNYVAFKPNQIKSATDNIGTYSTENDDIRFSFIGESGIKNLDIKEEAINRMHGLYIAREMIKKGKNIKEIKRATGWEIGKDGRWRYEIDEKINPSMIETAIQNPNSIIEKRKSRIEELEREGNSDLVYLYSTLSEEEFFLEEIIGYNNPLLIAYPDMRQTRVTFENRNLKLKSINGEYDPKFDTIKITVDKDTNFYREAGTLIHEIQHAIQEREGFAKGGSIEAMPKNKELDNLQRELEILDHNLQVGAVSINATKDGYKIFLPSESRDSLLKGLTNPEVIELIPEDKEIDVREVLKDVKAVIEEVEIQQYNYQLDQYLRLAGETEARAAASNMGLPEEYRRNFTIGDTIALEDQIIIGAGLFKNEDAIAAISNLQLIQNSINDILDYLSYTLTDNGRTSLVHKRNGVYYVTKSAFDGGNTQSVLDTYEKSKELIINHLIAEGLPADSVSFIDRDNSVRIIANPIAIYDTIKRNEELIKVEKLFNSSEEAKKVLNILNFLSNKTGLKYKVISEKEASRIIGTGNGIKKVNAFVKGDTCYFIEGRQLNVDIVAEEMLHPFVASIRSTNPIAFNSLLRDAKRAFSKLRLEIERTYKNRSKEEIQEEIVTQALSRAFREDIKNNPEGHSIKRLIKNFINRIVEIFQSFFGENNSEVITEYKTRVDEILEKEEITAQDLQSTITINELAKIVNSGLKLYSPSIESTRMNIESSSELETRTQNEEFMENNKALITELENLYDLGLTDTDIKTLGTQLMYWISEHLTVLHNTPGELKRVYGIEGKDVSTMSRKEIAELVTPKRLMEQCIREFRRPKAGMGWEDVEQLNDIADNARLLLFLSSNTFTTLEGFSIIMPGADFGIMANIDVTTNEFNGTNEDVEIQEEEGSSEEHWMRANTTITLDERISLDVKTAISKCYRIGKDGKPVISKWGIKERIPYEEARNIIVNVCSGCLTLNMMVEALDNAKKDYPWLEQLIVQIKPSENNAENGARSQLQSAFFRDIYMARNAYSIVKKSGKKYESVIVNENTALKEITNSIITEFTISSHPLFGEKLGVTSYNELVRLYNIIKDVTEITEENREEIINSLLGIYNHLGFYTINEDLVKSILTIENVKDITSSLKDLLIKTAEGYKTQEETGNKYYPFEYSIGKSAPNSILGNLRAILRIPASRIDNTTAFSIYDNGKMHQSFCTPSYLFKLMTKFQLKDNSKFSEFMNNEYKKYQWFAVDVNGKINYRTSWLQEMIDDPNTREILKHKIQLNFNKHNYMRNMTSHEYALSVLTEFFSEKSKLKGRDTAWYRVPMLSNKPSSEFIRFVRYTGPMYKTTITEALYKVYSQELSRIQTVRLRRQNPENVEYISNFDERGLEFCFLTFLNEHLGTSSELGLLMEQRLNGNTEVINQEEKVIKKAIEEWINQRSSEIIASWEDSGILEKAGEIANIGDNKIEVKRNIENFIWNDILASINIQELTITDPALYKDTEDIQKRIAQMHSPGIRPNVEAVDFDGNLVSDGNHRALTFKDPKDFEYVISNVIENITIICDRKLAIAEANLKKEKGTAVEVEEAKAFKELLVGKDGLYRQIEVADAQAYSCATSYRKKAFMFGKWSKSAEAVYKRLINNEYVTLSDIKTAFQPLKPFVYSQIPKSSGVTDAPMQTLKIGIQNKNSEYLLIMAEAMLQNEDTGKPNLLRAISEFMEESAERFPTKGIDTVQFGSAVKVGKQVRLIDISKAESIEDAKEIMRSFVYPNYVRGTWDTYVSKDHDNPYTEKVDTMPMEDYSIQQEVPAHFRDHQQVEGSQERAIIPSDLPSIDTDGNPVTFATRYNIDGTPTGHMSSKEFVREWEETHALNIEESIEMIIQELQLDSLSKKDRNIAIARLLQREILANPNRYGTDLLIACSLNDNYDFRVPLGDPIQSKRVEQLLNSVVKNRINKQTIAGGPIVQVSNFGMSRRLSIVFNGKDGKPLRKKKEGETEAEYKKYIADNQAGIAYMECMAPAYTKELFANFADEEGNIDVEAIEKTSPELLKMIGYRIPTEDKYSITPLKIVGFLPRVAGDGIMLPYDITLINGSDFDVKFIGVIKLC